MRHICLRLSYDGTAYAGWQRQSEAVTVQGAVEKALSKITKQEVKVLGSGRTDAGVHAHNQFASFKTHKTIELKAFVDGTNTFLPNDILVKDLQEVADTFHPIRSVKSKSYRYFFTSETKPNIFLNRYVYQIPQRLNVEAMKKAVAYFIGTFDFASFVTHGQVTATTVRTIFNISIQPFAENICFLEIQGNGFLRHMVRTIAGTLFEVGLGKRTPDEMLQIIEAKKRSHAGPTAPAHGLFLWDVEY